MGYLESDELSSTKGPATGPLRASHLCSSHLYASHGGSHATEINTNALQVNMKHGGEGR